DYFDKESETNRVMVLLSDGEDHEGVLEELTKEAAKKNIHIFTVGMGTAKGARIPIKERGVVKEFKKDWEGNTVITKMDRKAMQNIAQVTDGKYIDGGNTREVVDKFEEFLEGLEKAEFESKQFASFKSQFQ